ncbi:hypothetical protein ANN_03430 [Periplaneta americana]|uniref:Uncharacterized protein n=1 Tax=Periplaneta americana TaxID=6978 RepID=A0ABQ8TYX7_PERAM|nr:hypothetical protein ANN_03430 [Periplaneta americana]
MAVLREGGNESPGSLKASVVSVVTLASNQVEPVSSCNRKERKTILVPQSKVVNNYGSNMGGSHRRGSVG